MCNEKFLLMLALCHNFCSFIEQICSRIVDNFKFWFKGHFSILVQLDVFFLHYALLMTTFSCYVHLFWIWRLACSYNLLWHYFCWKSCGICVDVGSAFLLNLEIICRNNVVVGWIKPYNFSTPISTPLGGFWCLYEVVIVSWTFQCFFVCWRCSIEDLFICREVW